MKHVLILALEHCLQSSVTGFYDILTVANHMAVSPLFAPVIATPDGRPVTCFNGLTIQPQATLDRNLAPDLIYLPVIYGDIAPVLDDEALIRCLTRMIREGAVAAAVCAGVFVLAKTGALEGKEATTHWGLARRFEALFPNVRLKPEKMLVDEGSLITAGGVTAYMDLALYLIARFGQRDLAAQVSKSLLIDPLRASQSPYSGPMFDLSHGDEAVRTLQTWMGDHFSQCLTAARMAEVAGLEIRTLTRRFKKATGDTPLEYLQNLRLSEARRLFETTSLPVDQVTWAVGYQDISSFRRMFKQRTGLSPGAFRRRFGLGHYPSG